MPIPLLDAYLGFAFRDQPEVWPHLEARGLTLTQAQAAWDLKHERFGSDFREWTSGKAQELFGPPTVVTDTAIAWDLTLWPEHQFWGSVREAAKLYAADRISLRSAPQLTPLVSIDFAAVRSALRLGWHCDEQVRALLGTPVSEDGWSPEYSSFYGPMADGTCIEIVTEYGMTSGLKRALAPSGWIAPPPKPLPWWKRLRHAFPFCAV